VKKPSPILGKKQKAADRGAAAPSGTSLGRFALAILLSFVFLLLLALYLVQIELRTQFNAQRHLVASSVAKQQASRVAAVFAAYRRTLGSVAQDPELKSALTSRAPAALARIGQQLKYAFPDALRVRVLPPNVNQPDDSQSPPLGYACLDLLHQAERDKAPPPAEVHMFGTPQAHISMVRAVRSGAGKILGAIQVSLAPDLLTRALQTHTTAAEQRAYLALTQENKSGDALVLASHGAASVRDGATRYSTPVAGTAWTLAAWLPEPSMLALNARFWIVYGGSVLIAMGVVLILFRTLGRIIKSDVMGLMQLTRDILKGNKRYEQPLRLKEFKTASLMLTRLPETTTLARERDDASSLGERSMPNIARSGTSSRADFHTVDEGSMQVEELDEPPPPAPTTSSVHAKSLLDEDDEGDEPPPRISSSSSLGSGTRSSGGSGTRAVFQSAAPEGERTPLSASIFKAYDIRGIVGHTLTDDIIYRIGRAFATLAAKRGASRIVFGRDGRESGPELGGAFARGIRDSGGTVIDIGQVPTPVLYFAAAELADATGVMLTGSHNPPNYNGLKMMIAGDTLAGDDIQALRECIENEDYADGKGGYETAKVLSDYVRRVTEDIRLKRPLKVVVDCGNGVAGLVMPKLLGALGCQSTELFCDVDGRFPNHHPDPSQPENLQDLIQVVRQKGADLGLAFDGDGDRLGVVGGDGTIIWPDRQMMLFAADVLGRQPGASIIFDVKCSTNLARVINKLGGRPLMWRTGHSLIKAKMKQIEAPLAGEMSGHIFFKERWYGFDDALYAAARLLEILSKDKRSPREIFAALPDAVNTPELRIDMAEGEQHAFMDRLLTEADFPDGMITAIDGLRVDFQDGWGLVRASNTTPCLVARFEGTNAESLERVQESFRKELLKIEPKLKLPF